MFDIWVTLVPDASKERTASAVNCRWATINQDVQKFCGIMSQLHSQKKSGYNDEKYHEEATQVFKEERKGSKKGQEFQFSTCWEIL